MSEIRVSFERRPSAETALPALEREEGTGRFGRDGRWKIRENKTDRI